MSEDPRISEIRAVIDEWQTNVEATSGGGMEAIRRILDREPPAPWVLAPEHEFALSVARSAVLKAAGKFVTAADMYRKRDLLHSVQEMADSERACVQVASFLADEIAIVRAARLEVLS